MSRSPSLWSLIGLSLLFLSPAAFGGKKGFADSPLGGKNDPRLGLAVSVGPNQGEVIVTPGKNVSDPCGDYLFDVGEGRMAVPVPRVTFPTDASGANQFLLIEFPFAIDGKKARKSLVDHDAALAAQSFLTSNVQIMSETAAHVRGIPVIAGKTADGTSVKNHPGLPIWLDDKGKNRLVAKNAFLYVADQGDLDLATLSAFEPSLGDPEVSTLADLHLRIHEVAGISIHGAWMVKRGDGAPAGPLVPLSGAITATKPVKPPQLERGNLVVKRKTDFILTFSEPVVPLSVGVEKKWIKGFGQPFAKNLDVTLHPCDGSPLFPNVVLEWVPDDGNPKHLGFDVAPVNPNNLTQFRIRVLATPKGAGDLTVRIRPISQNVNPHPFATVASAVTSYYDVPYEDTTAGNATTFHIAGKK